MRKVKMILIDSEAREVKQITLEEDANTPLFKAMQRQVDGLLAMATYLPNNDCVMVNDEGLFKFRNFFILKDYAQPLAGNGLVVGTDNEGETVDAVSTVEDIEKSVQFIDIDKLKLLLNTEGPVC